ncbi:MAG: tetratricopeptide repeat protein [bacterium]|nr:tetratricopeptide repeat protein [bacterium]
MSKSMRLTDRAFRYLGNGLILSQEDKLQAEVSLTEARQKAQTCREWIQVGLAYLELGTPQEAAASFAKAEELDPQNPSTPLFAAIAATDLGQFEQAHKFLDKLDKISPQNQAAPTAKALLHLRENNPQKALAIIYPEQGRFDLTVSPPVLTRFAVAVEEYVFSRELPNIDNDLNTVLVLPSEKKKKNQEAAENSSAPATTEATGTQTETEVKPAEQEEATAEAKAETEPKPIEKEEATAEAKVETEPKLAEQEAATVETREESGSDYISPALLKEKLAEADVKDKEEADKLSALPGAAILWASKGSSKLKKAWDLHDAAGDDKTECLQALREARQDLLTAYTKDPHLNQLAYDLGEASLGIIELAHPKGTRLSLDELIAVSRAAQYIDTALEENEENAYTLHYVARAALLMRQLTKAKQAWDLALKYFAKLPESHYGLAQLYTITGDFGSARRYMGLSLSSDLQILRDRLKDLQNFANTSGKQ